MNKFGFSSFTLKVMAMIFMVIDHVGLIFFPHEIMFRYIGRLSFPIFCFLIVEGFYHTCNVYKYMGRLLLFAFISEYPFDLMVSGTGFYMESQNIFFTLFLGLVAIYFMDQFDKKYPVSYFFKTIAYVLIAVSISLIAVELGTDYSALGIFYIVIFYLYRGNYMLIFLCIEIITIYFFGLFSVAGRIQSQNFAGLAVIFTALYNGKKGPNIKYIFYVFYPGHIVVILWVYYCLYGHLPMR